MSIPVSNLTPTLQVSKLCFGTMTFGEQNSLSESFNLLDKAFDSGINFFDSAELYPVPQRAESCGRSEEYFGRWVRERKVGRHRVVFATKVSGPSGQMTWIRGGPTSLDSKNIKVAIDNRFVHVTTKSDTALVQSINGLMGGFCILENHAACCVRRLIISIFIKCTGLTAMFQCLEKLIMIPPDNIIMLVLKNNLMLWEEQLMPIKFIGVSNETPYGVMKFLQAAEKNPAYPRIISVQNSYNLLCRNFDSGLAECCHLERVKLLAYSPLAMGLLSGKYLLPDGGAADARLNLFRGRYSEGESRYNLSNPTIREAIKAYISIAERYDIHPVSLAIAFVLGHPLVSSAIFGATKLWQLEQVVSACEVKLNPEIIADLDEVHSRFPNPCS